MQNCFIGKKNKNIYSKKAIKKFILLTALVFIICFVLLLTGCVETDNPSLNTPNIIAGTDPSATATTGSTIAPSPTSDQKIEIDNSPTSGPYDPVIDFTDPYLENVIRELLEKSIGEIRLSDVQSITSLTARVKGIKSIADLAHFTSLEKLDLYGNKISDISALSGLTKLKVLNISKNYNSLYASDSASLGLNLNPISTLPLLEELYTEDNGISDLTSISNLAGLKILDLSHNAISDISALKNLVSLEKINVSYNKITNLSVLANCVALNHIDASNNYYEVMSDVNFYTGYGIKDISFAAKLKELTYINISMNMVNSIEPLSKLEKISEIYADDNYITDISCFKGNKTIKTLTLKRNYIINFDIILSMSVLKQLEYEGNPISQSNAIQKFEAANKIN